MERLGNLPSVTQLGRGRTWIHLQIDDWAPKFLLCTCLSLLPAELRPPTIGDTGAVPPFSVLEISPLLCPLPSGSSYLLEVVLPTSFQIPGARSFQMIP